jgi:hypothetical protein
MPVNMFKVAAQKKIDFLIVHRPYLGRIKICQWCCQKQNKALLDSDISCTPATRHSTGTPNTATIQSC